MNNNIIEIKNLKKSYKDKPVLKGVNLTVKKGEIFCLLGSNGAGKTTIINILSTLLKPDDGIVTIDNTDLLKKCEGSKEGVEKKDQMFNEYAPAGVCVCVYVCVCVCVYSLFGIQNQHVSCFLTF